MTKYSNFKNSLSILKEWEEEQVDIKLYKRFKTMRL